MIVQIHHGIQPKSLIEYFHMFITRKMNTDIAKQTNLYSVQELGASIRTTADEIEHFLGILILMGILKYSQYRLFWCQNSRVPLIADTMSRNRIDAIKRYFHVGDNSKMPKKGAPDYDSCTK